MSAFSAAATIEAAALAVTALGGWISLHTASPGTTGSNEAAGNGYARKQTGWSGGVVDGVVPGSQVTIDAGAATYTHFGIWTAANGGTYVDGGALSSPITLAAVGQIKVTPSVVAV